ncbi:MAG: ferritin family protein [Spirochaetales bacterium]|nr:ferritin family protein [Spirochaetales bacterium]
MSSLLSAREVLAIAQSIEENGAEFYRHAVTLHPIKSESAFLLRLAGMEEEHRQTFAMMQAEMYEERMEQGDENFINNMDLYLKAVTDSQNLEGSMFAKYLFSGEETMQEIVSVGMDLEKETILYYVGLLDLMKTEHEKKTIERIISEEKSHIITLAGEFKKLCS